MVAYSFKARFTDQVRAGLEPGPWRPGMKRNTLRQHRFGRSRHARPDELVQLYTAMRTKRCRLIGRGIACLRMAVSLSWDGSRITLWRGSTEVLHSDSMHLAPIVQQLMATDPGEELSPAQMEDFARADGFADAAEMAQFLRPPRATPAELAHLGMVLIAWAPREPG